MVSNIHDSIISNYFVRIEDAKVKPIISTYLRGKGTESMLRQTMKEFINIPMIKSLWEYSFLFQNLYDINLAGWESIHFRGEPKEYSKPNQSSWLRNHEPNPDKEIEVVRDFQSSTKGKELMNDFVASGLPNPENHYWWWFLAQHYSYKTRLLDITRNPYVALYWACEKHHGESGYVYVHFDVILREVGRRSIDGIIEEKQKLWQQSPYLTFEEFIRDPQEQFELNRPLKMNEDDLEKGYVLMKRLIAQSGEFIVTKNSHVSNFPLEIDGDSKAEILKQLKDFMNIDKWHLTFEK